MIALHFTVLCRLIGVQIDNKTLYIINQSIKSGVLAFVEKENINVKMKYKCNIALLLCAGRV